MEDLIQGFDQLWIETKICVLCNFSLDNYQFLKTLDCCHYFHVSCLFEYFDKGNYDCPICQLPQPVDFYYEYLIVLGLSEQEVKFVDFNV